MNNLNWKHIAIESLYPIVVFDKETGYALEANKMAKKQFEKYFKSNQSLHYSFLTNSHHNTELNELNIFFSSKQECYRCSVNLDGNDYNVVLRFLAEGDKILVVAEFKEVYDIKTTSIGLSKELEFRKVLSQLINNVNQSPHHELNDLIKEGLRLVGQYFETERCYVFFYSDDERFTSIAGQWHKDGIIPFSEWIDIPIVHFQYVAGKLLSGDIFCINKMTDIPEEAITERNGMIAEGVKSVLLVPFKSRTQTLGFLGIDMVSEERTWKEEEVVNLNLFGSIIANLEIQRRDYNKKSFHEVVSSMFFDDSHLAVGIFKDNRMIDCNSETLNLLSCAKKDLIGKSVFDLTYWDKGIRKEQEELLVQLLEQTKKGQKPVREWKIKKPDGSLIHAQLIMQSFRFKKDFYIAISAIDISNRIEKEEELLMRQKELTTKLNKLLSPSTKMRKVRLLELLDKEQLFILQEAFSLATGIPSVITDIEGNVISSVNMVNPICDYIKQSKKGVEVCQMSSEILQTKVSESLKPEWHKCLGCGFLDAAAPIVVEGSHVGTWWIGKVKPVDASKEKILSFSQDLGINVKEVADSFDAMKSISYESFENALHLLKVLTVKLSTLAYNNIKLSKALQSRKRMERKLERAKQKAEESDRLKSAFLANMSHEIRTPMNGIIGFTELIQGPEIEPDERYNYISIIQESSNQLLNIINDIIDISKIEAGQIDLNQEKFELKELFNELYLFYASLAQKKGIELFYDNEYPKLIIKNDKVKLKQVFSNLIGNAIKFTHTGYVKFGIKDSVGGKLSFYVEDTGIGVETKDQKQIFNRFWQVGKHSSNKGGTGLGLTITKAYVELMGGHISISSELNIGTVFNFEIPLNYSQKNPSLTI